MPNQFQRIGLLGRREHPGVNQVVADLLSLLDQRGVDVTLEDRLATLAHFEKRAMMPREQIGAMVDLAIVIGGDGSLLSAARMLVRHDTPVIGINRGRLGFLTDVSPDDVLAQVNAVLDGDYHRDSRFLLDAEVRRDGVTIGSAEALNDVVVNSGTSAQMIEFELNVDGEFVYRLNADGLIVSTPTGSTAYSMSGGGPIMNPHLDAIVLVPMFPHSLTSRPIVVEGNSEIRIDVVARNFIHPPVTCDGQVSLTALPGDAVFVRKKDKPLTLLHPPGYSFYASCRDKLRWSDALIP
ncbi:nicotinamide adenine dinucleotide kinase [Luminiphilus syltensis NOR5-1B]|uniref:NAD kinase n=1 Tax=Luminiphilus syltensis NOR5-1B TaxID=565045 RepID=B8KXW1_9GAMM|nr:NAD(+) kinase [Luminiphilus syltensis]EED35102.1 nicotinamide adenine dinucleotide kinase [Luminiphilus syltensis NOR5-1B]